MPISACRHCVCYFITEATRKGRCPICRRKLTPATPEEWQQAREKPSEKPFQLPRR